ncbi:MAG: RES domain-containing protein [Rhodospirillales bacterium]|nr:RES domain-containing protein [Rhodospirillales bacterium]
MRYAGTVYRAHNPEWAWSPLSGEGARRHGGRFNRPGVAALYTSLSPLTALLEASPLGRPMQPLTLCAYRVDAEPVFDARDRSILAAHGASAVDVECPNWNREMLEGQVPASQRLADRLHAAGFFAMLVPSFARGAGGGDDNLVFWKWGDNLPSRVRVIDDDRRLPSNPASWR